MLGFLLVASIILLVLAISFKSTVVYSEWIVGELSALSA